MRIFILIAILLLATTSFSQVTFPVNGPRDDRDIAKAFINATIHVDFQTVVQGGTLLIAKDKVAYAGSAIPLAAGVEVIDLKGKHIYPAFIDLYSDYGLNNAKKETGNRSSGPQYERSENKPTTWNDALKPEYEAAVEFKYHKETSEKLLQMGVGAVLTHRKDGIARGTGALVALGEGLANKNLLVQNTAAFYSFQKGSSKQRYPSSLMGAIALLRQTYIDANWYAKKGINEEINIGLQAWNGNQSLPQIFVLTEKNDIYRAQQLGEEFGVKYILKTGGDEYQRIGQTVYCGAQLIVPINFPKAYNVNDPYDANLVSLQELKHWESASLNLAILYENGMDFCITTDGNKTVNEFLQNLRRCVSSGLPSSIALKALTYSPAQFIGVEEQLGALNVGKMANFFIASDSLFNSKAEILETWVLGERNTHKDYLSIDIRGIYNLNVENVFFTIQITGELNKPTAKSISINAADTISTEVKLQAENGLVNFSFDAQSADYKGFLRFSGNVHKESRIWEGQMQKPNGDWVPWTAVRQKEKVKPETTKTDSIKVDQRQAVFFPNRAYGVDTLPIAETILFKEATIWTCGPDGIIENGEMLIQDGVILAVGKNLNLLELLGKKAGPPKVLMLKGKHITPGLIDEHSHIAISRGVNEGSKASSAEVRIGDVINPEDINIYRQLAGGVTTVQQLHGSANPIGGQSSIIKLRWGRNAGEMRFENAPGFIKFALGENVKQSNWGDVERVRYPQTRMGVEQVYYDHFIRAKEYELAKNSVKQKTIAKPKSKLNTNILIPKKKENTTESIFRTDLELECLLEILKDERFITCHSYVQSEINMLMHVADSMNFRVNTFTHVLEGYKVADKLKAHGAGASTFSDWWAYKFEVNDAIPYNAAIMHQQGVVVAINSDDAEMGRRLNQEAAKAIKYGGVSEQEALNMVTLNPAKLLHIDHRVGSLTVGKDADIVVWSANPLSVYAQVEQTFVDGASYFSKEQHEYYLERDKKERARIITNMASSPEKSDEKKPSENPNDKLYHCDDVDEEI